MKVNLKSKKGAAYIETMLMVMVAVFLLALLISVVDLGANYSKVVTYANDLAGSAAITGQIDTDPACYTELAGQTGLHTDRLSYSWDAEYFDESTHKLAFRQPFSVTVTYSCPLAVFGKGSSISIPIKYVGRGSSGVFWK